MGCSLENSEFEGGWVAEPQIPDECYGCINLALANDNTELVTFDLSSEEQEEVDSDGVDKCTYLLIRRLGEASREVRQEHTLDDSGPGPVISVEKSKIECPNNRDKCPRDVNVFTDRASKYIIGIYARELP